MQPCQHNGDLKRSTHLFVSSEIFVFICFCDTRKQNDLKIRVQN